MATGIHIHYWRRLLLIMIAAQAAACSWLPSGAHHHYNVPAECVYSLMHSKEVNPKTLVQIRSHSTSTDRLILISAIHSDEVSVTALNTLGAKRFHALWTPQSITVTAAPFGDETLARYLSEGSLLAHALSANTNSQRCSLHIDPTSKYLLVDGEQSAYHSITLSRDGATFNIPHLGYNVALSYLK